SWLMMLTYLSRTRPNDPCTVVFTDPEWQAIHCYHNKSKLIPKSPPTLREITTIIARMGGYLARANDPPPGVKVLWRGLAVAQDIIDVWNVAKSIFMGNA